MYKRILLVDDDKDDGDLFGEALQQVDASVTFKHLHDERKAFESLSNWPADSPDLIFLDINMPAVSGWDLLRKIRNDETLKHVPVIMYTTSSQIKEARLAEELKATGFITKPSDFRLLVNMLTDILRTPGDLLQQLLKEFRHRAF